MKIGTKLKELSFTLDDDSEITNKDLKGKKLIIYFYPKDDTPGCTKEAIGFSENLEKFSEKNTSILGVSKDTVQKHQKFISKHELKIKLVSDESLAICKEFKTWVEKSMYGRKYMGIERSTFLFDENLVLIKCWRNVKVNGHVEEVLEFISSQV